MKKETTLLSFHGDQAIKDKYMVRVKNHYEMDEIIKGKYWEKGKGCAVGCTIHSDRHDDYPPQLGITWQLALIEDSIFESLPNDQAKEWPLQFLDAIPVGANTDLAYKKWVLWCIADEKDGLLTVIKGKKQREILEEVTHLYRESYTREVTNAEWKAVEKKAFNAFAFAFAFAYAYTYTSAYTSAYAFASNFKTNTAERIILMRDKLIEFLKELEPCQ